MPTVLRIDGFRFFFYSKEGFEPPHIHIEQGDDVAKFWLEPVEMASSYGFSTTQLNKIYKLVVEHQSQPIQAWHEYFN